jgi:murein DD-endopeptidase MepM/ murein hydrolase activator NlpD
VRRFLLIFTIPLSIVSLLLSFVPSQAQEATPTPIVTPTIVPTLIPRPVPSSTITQDGATLELLFTGIVQGQVGVVHLSGAGVTGARANFADKLTEFFPVEGDGFYGLISVDLDQTPSTNYPLEVYADYGADTHVTLTAEVPVLQGAFIRQDVTVGADLAYLLDPQVERNEFARLESLYDNFTLTRYWSGGAFQYPIPSVTTAPFGAFRVFNDTLTTRHTGWDLRAAVGTPVMAMASGVVAFAGLMDVRGNYVFIDHGYGVYSGYAHLSQIHVTRGQEIVEGQIIGVSGNTGRSSGAHFHWEMVVNGNWIDTVQFLQTWLP